MDEHSVVSFSSMLQVRAAAAVFAAITSLLLLVRAQVNASHKGYLRELDIWTECRYPGFVPVLVDLGDLRVASTTYRLD
jgi:hypothetical protein